MNVSRGKAATQSSTDFGGTPERAVDGNTSGVYNNNSVTHTAFQDQAWWQVDLGRNFALERIRLWNRTDCCADRLANLIVYVSAFDMSGRTRDQLNADAAVWKTQVALLNGADNLVLAAAANGRYVRVQLAGNGVPLSLAEVEVFGTEAAAPPAATNLAPTATLATSFVSAWETLASVNNAITPASSADKTGGAYGNWNGDASFGATHWVSFTWSTAKTLSAFEVYWWNDGLGISTPTYALVEYWNGSAWVALGSPALALNGFNRLGFAPVTTTSIRVSMKSALATGILEARVFGVEAAAPAAANLASNATLATSFVSAWETLAAVNNNIAPANSADKTGGAYGNWNGPAAYGTTNWVSFSFPAARTVSAFEVYWWNDGQGIGTPTTALVEYWNGTAWVSLGSPGLALNGFNRLNFGAVSTTSIQVSMKSALATGILEARVLGY